MPVTTRLLAGTVLCFTALSVATIPSHAQTEAVGAAATKVFAFRDALNSPPNDWMGPVFKLSDAYPREDPGTCPKNVCTWLGLKVDFSANLNAAPPTWDKGPWADYIKLVMDYVKKGQDPQLDNKVGFQTMVDGETRWFHVPWMAYDETAGREFIHGTTNERTAHLSDLIGPPGGTPRGVHELPNVSPECEGFEHGFETWAVGVYNAWGAYVIGQAVPPSGVPQVGSYMGNPIAQGAPFPEGTVVAKFLTTNATPECVPYLKGAPEWTVNRHKKQDDGVYLCEREVQVTRLVQVDVAVVDLRSPTHWVFGTFAYSADADGETVWDHLLPVGLQWGSDPWTFPAVPEAASRPARQSVLNTGIGIYEHFGCRGRLAGPVDNKLSSCLSCHASAFAAANGQPGIMGQNIPSSFGFTGICDVFSQQNQDYFANIAAPQHYTGGNYPTAVSLDTSLQLSVAYTQFGFYNTQGKPQPCTDPDQF